MGILYSAPRMLEIPSSLSVHDRLGILSSTHPPLLPSVLLPPSLPNRYPLALSTMACRCCPDSRTPSTEMDLSVNGVDVDGAASILSTVCDNHRRPGPVVGSFCICPINHASALIQPSVLQRLSTHFGFTSSHFFRRLLQVAHPVLDQFTNDLAIGSTVFIDEGPESEYILPLQSNRV
jgi:hypothetical protein